MNSPEGRFIESDQDEKYDEIVYRMRKSKPDLVPQRKKHTCSRDECNPQSEEHLVQNGLLQGPPLSSNVYMCKYGTVHVCSTSSCRIFSYAHNQTCHISGQQLGTIVSSYDKNDSRTWYGGGGSGDRVPNSEINTSNSSATHKRARTKSAGGPEKIKKPRQKRKFAHKVLSEEAAKEQAASIIINLLYSSARTKRNQVAAEIFQKEAEKAKNTYVNQQRERGQLPFLVDICRLTGHYTSQPLPLKEFVLDEALKDYYVSVIYQVWCIIRKHIVPQKKKVFEEGESTKEVLPRIDFEAICLGVLYSMRNGMSVGGKQVLPVDEFLLQNLPIITDLTYFGVEKSKITKASVMLSVAYQNAVGDGVPFEEIMIDVTKLPQKNQPVLLFKALDSRRRD